MQTNIEENPYPKLNKFASEDVLEDDLGYPSLDQVNHSHIGA